MFSASCPVDYRTKEWVEDSLHLLGSVFGRRRLVDEPVVEPTAEYFPEEVGASLDGAYYLLEQAAHFLGTDSHGIELQIVPRRDELWLTEDQDIENAPSSQRPQKEEIVYALELDDLGSPERLVGLFGRELSALRLIEDAGISIDAYDFGRLADLAAVYLGLGVFVAALPLVTVETDDPGGRPIPMNLSPIAAGYALAHIAWHQEADKPSWLKYLHPDVKACVKQGIKYLKATGESDFAPR